MSEEFTDIGTLRARAGQHARRAVTEGQVQPDVVLRLLNEALATEIVCVIRYRRHHFMATGIHAQDVAAEFLAHAGEEQGHADQLAARILQLGDIPDFDPRGLHSRSYSEYVAGVSLMGMIREDLAAERIEVDSYSEMIRCIADSDPTTRTMLERILATEEEHAECLANLEATLEAKAEPQAHESKRVSLDIDRGAL
jgi:bacterioferritin